MIFESCKCANEASDLGYRDTIKEQFFVKRRHTCWQVWSNSVQTDPCSKTRWLLDLPFPSGTMTCASFDSLSTPCFLPPPPPAHILSSLSAWISLLPSFSSLSSSIREPTSLHQYNLRKSANMQSSTKNQKCRSRSSSLVQLDISIVLTPAPEDVDDGLLEQMVSQYSGSMETSYKNLCF